MTADEFWLTYRDRIQAHVAEVQYGDPSTHADDRVPASSWEQEEAVKSAFDLFMEIAVVCDRPKLLQLLRYLVDPGPTGVGSPVVSNPYQEASDLLKQIEGR